jgi:hypothetical protein
MSACVPRRSGPAIVPAAIARAPADPRAQRLKNFQFQSATIPATTTTTTTTTAAAAAAAAAAMLCYVPMPSNIH